MRTARRRTESVVVRLIAFGLAAAVVATAAGLGGEAAADDRRPDGDSADGQREALSVLFLGDRGPHEPHERVKQLAPAMKRRGINVLYTESTADLNAETLSRYDAVLVYANIDRIREEQAQALVEYVESGGGFVPVHCASYCFRNSEAYVELVGAQFRTHGTGTFSTRIVEPKHPVMRGFEGFESWDETYVHTQHNPEGRTVLSYRHGDEQGEGREKEPWTWVRRQGEGRVFYTAWGHDHRTWSKPGFIGLIERGIRWAAGDDAPAETIAERPELPAFEFTKQDVPFYPAGAEEWGKESDAWNKMQLPLEPGESRRWVITPGAFEAKLFAAEPEIRKPICMAWDARGRLWIAETVDYPNDVKPNAKGNDRIRICEDTDGDGRADEFTVFADELNIPTSLVFANGGVIVHAPPKTLFLKDTDGDDKADVRKVLFEGWSTEDTHAGPSNLVYGPDNWIWGTVGYAGFDGTIAGEPRRFRMGVYRFRPDGSALEFVRSTRGNTWGLGFNEAGDVFGSMATSNNPSFHIGLPDRYVKRVKGWRRQAVEGIQRSPRFLPMTERVRQVDRHGNYTAAAGHSIYTARTYPKRYWNRTAFVGGPTGHLLGTFVIERDGAGYRSHNPFNLAASADAWFSPIQAKVGPDGHVWMIDWYNYIIQHNPTPKGHETGKGNAYETELRDKQRGRIYRVVYEGAEPGDSMDLSDATPAELVDALTHPNMLWRKHAQRLLVERGKTDVVPALIEQARDTGVDAIGLNVGAIHALWTLHGLGALERSGSTALAAVHEALHHPSPGVRVNALRVLPGTATSRESILNGGLLSDDDPAVRKAALLALAETPASKRVGAAVFGMLAEQRNSSDRWIVDAASTAGAIHHEGFLAAAEEARSGSDGTQSNRPNLLPNPSFERPSEAAGGDRPAGWKLRNYSGPAEHRYADGVARTGNRSVRIASKKGSDTSWFAQVKLEAGARYRLSGYVKTKGVETLGNAYGALFNVHGKGRTATDAVTGTSGWRRVAVEFTAESTRRTINCLFGGWGKATGTAWFDDVRLVKIGGPRSPLRRAIEIVSEHAERAGGGAPEDAANGPRSADYLKGGEVAAGRTVFAENKAASCLRCHAVNGQGGNVGPDLSSLGARKSRRYIVESLLKPNAKIAEGYPNGVSPMPPMHLILSDEQIRDVAAYLESLE